MIDTLVAHIRQLGGDVYVIDISGDLTGYSEDTLMNAYSAAGNGRSRAIILNFSDLAYMNSSGIGLLVTLLIRTQRQKQHLLAFGLSDHYRQIFELTRLDEAIGLFESETAAVTAVAGAVPGR